MAKQISAWTRLVGSRDVAGCRQAAELLQAALDDEIDASSRDRVLRHLEACRRCGLEADTYRAIRTHIGEQYQYPPDEAAIADLEAFGRHLTQQ